MSARNPRKTYHETFDDGPGDWFGWLDNARGPKPLERTERGVMLGNFAATAITPKESWVTDFEYILTGEPHAKGADGATWLGRIQWSKLSSPIQPLDKWFVVARRYRGGFYDRLGNRWGDYTNLNHQDPLPQVMLVVPPFGGRESSCFRLKAGLQM